MSKEVKHDFIDMIRSELAGRKPIAVWYIGPELLDHMPYWVIENITSAHGFDTDLGHLPNGGLLLQFYASSCSISQLEKMIGGLSALYKMPATEVV